MIESVKNISGLIIEGIPGSGKSTLLKSIMSNTKFLESNEGSLIVFNEFQTQRVLEQKEKNKILTKSDNIYLLNSHLNYLQTLNILLKESDWCNSEQTGHRIQVIFERFHLTHLYYYSFIRWEDIAQIDQTLFELNFKLCVLTVERDSLKKRIITERKNDSSWMNFIKRYGHNDDTIIDSFMEQQKTLFEGVRISALPKIIIDTSNKDVSQTTDEAMEFLLNS